MKNNNQNNNDPMGFNSRQTENKVNNKDGKRFLIHSKETFHRIRFELFYMGRIKSISKL
jgi:hypothetical protein